MGKPIAPAKMIAFAFPDVCQTPTPAGPVPIPYPNIAQLSSAESVSETLFVKGDPVLLLDSTVSSTSGDEAGSSNGVKSGSITGAATVKQASESVLYAGKGIARLGDQTEQNGDNAVGFVLAAEPSVLVGD